ncbi:MAG TPA: hypothetical protein VGI83_01150, partial [Gemmatimonadales bacterium]
MTSGAVRALGRLREALIELGPYWPRLVGLAVFAAALAVQGKAVAHLAGDDALYPAMGLALAHGRWAFPHLPGAPLAVGPGPLYPGVLALVWRAWPSYPANETLSGLIDAVCFAAAASLFGLHLLRQRCGPIA